MRCHFPPFGDIQLWTLDEMVDLISLVAAVHPPLSQVALEQSSGSEQSGQCSQQVLVLPATCSGPNLVPRPTGVRLHVCSPHKIRGGGPCTAFSQLRLPSPSMLLLSASAWSVAPELPLIPSAHFWLSSLRAPSHLSDHLNLTALQGLA